jgi:hypothetical protein
LFAWILGQSPLYLSKKQDIANCTSSIYFGIITDRLLPDFSEAEQGRRAVGNISLLHNFRINGHPRGHSEDFGGWRLL